MLSDPPSYLLFGMGVIGLIFCYYKWRELDRKFAEERRQWIRDVNKLAEQYGHQELAGTPDNPDAAYVRWFEADQTPAQVISAVFGSQQPTS
jgi:hypothetical protein